MADATCTTRRLRLNGGPSTRFRYVVRSTFYVVPLRHPPPVMPRGTTIPRGTTPLTPRRCSCGVRSCLAGGVEVRALDVATFLGVLRSASDAQGGRLPFEPLAGLVLRWSRAWPGCGGACVGRCHVHDPTAMAQRRPEHPVPVRCTFYVLRCTTPPSTAGYARGVLRSALHRLVVRQSGAGGDGLAPHGGRGVLDSSDDSHVAGATADVAFQASDDLLT